MRLGSEIRQSTCLTSFAHTKLMRIEYSCHKPILETRGDVGVVETRGDVGVGGLSSRKVSDGVMDPKTSW